MNEWISVEDRLPTGDGEYIVCIDGGWVFSAVFHPASRMYLPGESGWYGKFGEIKNTVTHWMRMPEPPEV